WLVVAHYRQHVGAVDFRRQYRGSSWPFFLFAVLSDQRVRGGIYAYPPQSRFKHSQRRRKRRDCRSDGSVLRALSPSACADACAVDRVLHILVVAGVDRAGILVPDSVPERGGNFNCL